MYVFSLSAAAADCPAGVGRVLKVGKVGPNSSARFTSQHYSPRSSSSNLAKSLLEERVLWPYLGITDLDPTTVKKWMLTFLDRDQVLVEDGDVLVARELERYFRGHLGPVFEG